MSIFHSIPLGVVSSSSSWTPQKYINLGFGGLICWEVPTYLGTEIGSANLSVNVFHPLEKYPNDTPQKKIDSWISAAKLAEMKYLTLVTKHHDGFCLWDTEFKVTGSNPFSIAQGTWYAANGNPDIVKIFVDTCRSNNITPCLYFSIWDIEWEYRTGKTEKTDSAAYTAMIKAQLTELLTNYGEILAIWLDGWAWHISFDDLPYAPIYNHIKSISPKTFVINNTQEHPAVHSDIEVFEYDPPVSIPEIGWGENVKTIYNNLSAKWFYAITNDNSIAGYRTPKQIRDAIIVTNAVKCNYHIAISPDLTGHLPDTQRQVFELVNTTFEELFICDIVSTATDTELSATFTNNGITGDGISVRRSTDGVNFTEIDTIAIDATSFTDSGLTAETKYYYRLHVFTGLVVSDYYCEHTVTTEPTPSGIFDADNNEYFEVVIGTQTWLKGHLKTTKYRNGESITNVTNAASWAALITEGYVFFNNDAATYKEPYGALYNWYAINDARGICPVGYHIPTESEINTLISYLGGESSGGKLKEIGTDHWNAPNLAADNSSGFTAVGAGYRNPSGTFEYFKNLAVVWTKTEVLSTTARYFYLSTSTDDILVDTDSKKDGMSVWMIKD